MAQRVEGQDLSGNCTCIESDYEQLICYVVEKIFIPIVGLLGLLGNIAAILILRRPEMRSTFHQSLITLAAIDSMILIIALSDYSIDLTDRLYVYMFPYFLYPMRHVLFSWETFLIMGIATERLLAVYKPI